MMMEQPQTALEATKPPLTFFDLPAEIRYQIYSLFLLFNHTIDFDPHNYRELAPMLRIFRVSKRFHADAAHYFYSQNKFRLFPTHGNFFSNRQMPLVRCLTPTYRLCIEHLELRFGPGWTKPPRSWTVRRQLGLADLKALRRLDVHIDIDPSSSVFAGFRKSDTFYTEFSSKLLKNTIVALPSIEEVIFAGYSHATLEDPLLNRLVAETKEAGMQVAFGGSWTRTFTTTEDSSSSRRVDKEGIHYITLCSSIAMPSMRPKHVVV